MGPDRHVGMQVRLAERALDEIMENSRLRVWYVASYGQYEATCPMQGREFS